MWNSTTSSAQTPRSASSASNRTATEDACAGMVHLAFISFALDSVEQDRGQTPGKRGVLRRPGANQIQRNALIGCMSRAFVNEYNFVDDMPYRQFSDQPNIVTEQGMVLIENALVES